MDKKTLQKAEKYLRIKGNSEARKSMKDIILKNREVFKRLE